MGLTPNQLGLVLRARKRVSRVGKPTQSLQPVILVPGILGTTLIDPEVNNFPVWGSYKGSFFYSDKYEDLDQSILENVKNRLIPGEAMWSFPVVPGLFAVPIYEELARTLEGLGYQRTPTANSIQNGFYGLAYDWRQGVLAGARAVEIAVDGLRKSLGDVRVNLIGHSFGSLVIRYYLRYGGADLITANEPPRPGAKNLRAIFSIGAPFSGCLRAFEELNHGFLPGGPIGRAVSPHHIASNPVAYQLIRHERDFAVDENGTPLDLDLCDVNEWERLGWGALQQSSLEAMHKKALRHRKDIQPAESRDLARALVAKHLSHGRKLRELLHAPHPLDAETRTVTYASANLPTLSKAVIEKSAQGHRVAFNCDQAKRWPKLAAKLTVQGDGYLDVDEIRLHAGGVPEVNRAEDISNASYILIADTKGHRHLLQSDPILTNLANHLAHAASVQSSGQTTL